MTYHADLVNRAATILQELSTTLAAAPVLSLADLAPARTALVVVDMLNGFAKQGALASERVAGLIPPVARIQQHFQAQGSPILAFADAHPEDAAEFVSFPPHCIAGTPESELVDELKAVGGYTLIPKNSTNGFLEPAFQAWRAANEQIDTYVIVGDCTDICILQFALSLKADANRLNRPLRVIVPAAAVDTFDIPGHDGDFMHLTALTLMAGGGIEVVRDLV